MYGSVDDLMLWQRITRREADELATRAPLADTPVLQTPIPGAELLCPACSSEARPDEGDTATCGTCGTLSPLDSTVAYSNYVHQTLHSGIRVRAAMHQGQGGQEIAPPSQPFPGILVRLGSLFALAAVSGMRRSQLDELLAGQKPLLNRWVQKEIEQGDRHHVANIPSGATGLEIAQVVLDNTVGDLPAGFPNPDSIAFTLEQVYQAAAQYYKFRTTSTYAAMLSDGLADALRRRLDLAPRAPLPWKEASKLARSLDPAARGENVLEHHRGSEEALTRALVVHLSEEIRLVRGVISRHRVAQQVLA